QRDRQAVLHLVVVNRRDQLRLDADASQRRAVFQTLHRAHFAAVEVDTHRQRAEFDVRIFEVLQVDLEIAADVAILARIRDALRGLVVADVIHLRLEQSARVGHPRYDRRGVGVNAARQVPTPARVEFSGDDDVGVADEADQGDEGDHHQEGDACRVAPEKVFDRGTLCHPGSDYQTRESV